MRDLISVIVPIYNVENLLERCVDSIIGQTYDKLEIILVNDGSPDNSAKICESYARKDDRVRVLHKRNGGLSSARNEGLEIANGDLVSFIDSDDWISPNYFEVLYDLINKGNSDISVCDYEKIFSDNQTITNNRITTHLFSTKEALEGLSGKFNRQLVPAWGSLYKKYLFDSIRFPVGKIHEDEFVAHEVINKASKVSLTTEKLLYYWQRDDSIMGSGFKVEHRMNALEALNSRADLFESLGLSTAKANTYRSLFIIVQDIYPHINQLNEKDRIQFMISFSGLKLKLDEGSYSLPFVMLYKAFYLSPKTVGILMQGYIKVRLIVSK